MNDEAVFPDSNIWLYAFMRVQDPEKHIRAMEIIDGPDVRISTQVVGEVCNTLLKKGGKSEDEIERIIRTFYDRYVPIQVDGPERLLRATDLRKKYHFSHWDSWIVCAALESGCSTLYSEDMHDGLVVEGTLTIRNPFR